MIFKIKRTDSGRVIFSCEAKTFKECVEKAVSRGVDLSFADLSGRDLSNAILVQAKISSANFSFSDLSDAKLSLSICSFADFTGAKMERAYLRNSDAMEADFTRANMSYAVLTGVCLHGSKFDRTDLYMASFDNASLREVSFNTAIGADLVIAQQSIVPETGSFIGYKKVSSGKIVTLLIPGDAKRLNSYGSRKCRADKAIVLNGSGVSKYDENFKYVAGETVFAREFSSDRSQECEAGIHFFITRAEAEDY